MVGVGSWVGMVYRVDFGGDFSPIDGPPVLLQVSVPSRLGSGRMISPLLCKDVCGGFPIIRLLQTKFGQGSPPLGDVVCGVGDLSPSSVL